MVTPPSVIITVIASVADSPAAVAGVNVTLTVQEAPDAMLAPQVLDGDAKSTALLPLKERSLFANGIGSDVLFVNVTVWAAEVTDTGCTPKLRLVGATVMVGIKVSLATYPSEGPFKLLWKAPGFGKTGNAAVEKVCPVT